MKKFFSALLCFLLLFALAGCGNTTPTQKLLGRKWSDTKIEKYTYDVTGSNGSKGVFTQTIQKVDNAKIGNLEFNNISGYLLESSLVFGDDEINQTLLFSSTGKDELFPPMASIRTSFINGKFRTEQIEYNNNKAKITVTDLNNIPAEANAFSKSITYPYYDNQQIYTIIRSADINSKFSLAFSVLIPIEDELVKLSTRFNNEENVVTNFEINGEKQSYNCNKILILRNQKITGAPNLAYFATTKIDIDGTPLQQVLIKFVESDCTYLLNNIEVLDIEG